LILLIVFGLFKKSPALATEFWEGEIYKNETFLEHPFFVYWNPRSSSHINMVELREFFT
jgi:hypothetical protein